MPCSTVAFVRKRLSLQGTRFAGLCLSAEVFACLRSVLVEVFAYGVPEDFAWLEEYVMWLLEEDWRLKKIFFGGLCLQQTLLAKSLLVETPKKMLCSAVVFVRKGLSLQGTRLAEVFACLRSVLVEVFAYGGHEELAMPPLKIIKTIKDLTRHKHESREQLCRIKFFCYFGLVWYVLLWLMCYGLL